MVYGMVRNEHDAWDLAQEAFLKAWRSIHLFEGRSSFYTWLYKITMNLTIDSLRRNGHFAEVELNDAIPSFLPSPRVNCQRTEIREWINAALAKLSPEHRAVVDAKGLGRFAISGDFRGFEYLDRYSHVPPFLCEKAPAIPAQADLQPILTH